MSNIKILHRRPNKRVYSIPMEVFLDEKPSLVNRLMSALPSLPKASAIEGKLSEIKNLVTSNIASGAVDAVTLGQILSKLKLPLIAVLGVAFIAGLAYLIYKLVTSNSKQTKDEVINTIIKDLDETGPDLIKIPGWKESIRQEVLHAVETSSPEQLVVKIAQLKEAVANHQKKINPANVGMGFISMMVNKKVGAGIKII